jgi:hypothetical protein
MYQIQPRKLSCICTSAPIHEDLNCSTPILDDIQYGIMRKLLQKKAVWAMLCMSEKDEEKGAKQTSSA